MNTLEQQQNKQEKNTFSYADWIEKALINSIEGACLEFWEDKYNFLFQSITDSASVKNDIATKNDAFFIKKFDAGQNREVIIRFSSSLVGVFLHVYLASSQPKFNLKTLTELEAKLFNTFAQFIYDKIKVNFADYDSLSKEEKNLKGVYNLTLNTKKLNYPSGKISVTIPKNIVSPKEVVLKDSFSNEDFFDSSIFIKLKAGTTKMTLSELKSLSKDDILLLEDSNINLLKVKTNSLESTFKINPDLSLIVDLNENELKNTEGENMVKNVWDDIQIEVSAEFNKVKMTLGELKQITSGMVIDLGDIFDNKISLVVEDKTVAKGNLIIINDKYGVKIDEIISENDEIKDEVVKTNMSKNVPVKKEKAQIKQEIEENEPDDIGNDEDFDYSNVDDGE